MDKRQMSPPHQIDNADHLSEEWTLLTFNKKTRTITGAIFLKVSKSEIKLFGAMKIQSFRKSLYKWFFL